MQYLRTLALVLTARHAVLVAVESAADVLGPRRFRQEADRVATAIGEGRTLSDALGALSIIPPVAR